jgi:hypothetical protein
MEEGICMGNRTLAPEEFQTLQRAVENGIAVLYACHSLRLEPEHRALCTGARHGLLELREVLHEAWTDFQDQGESLTRGAGR